MSGHDADAEERVIVLSAARLDGQWVTRADEHGVVVHGRTLRAVAASAEQAAALRAGTTTTPPVQVRPVAAELDQLDEARQQYEAALRAAVRHLRESGCSWSDVALACQVRAAEAQAIAMPDLDVSFD
ncbi:hypothetical protein ACIBH1_45795 [Nonomuraea sp. NPDC050663]|uniref:hypothetical protein n=1 Tax=Nonomuraea sp. NPDC050663 TaxID=3364370 RepID=UPI0037A478E5